MYEEDFCKRLSELRTKKGVSARRMSLAIGQNAGYISHIENRQAMPSLPTFFNICEYLNTTPEEFFKNESKKESPVVDDNMLGDLKTLTSEQITCISYLIEELKQKD